MTNEQALTILYQAARSAQLSADDHERVRMAASVLQETIQGQETTEKAAEKTKKK